MSLRTKLIAAFTAIVALILLNSSVCIQNNQTIDLAFKQVTEQAFPELVTLDNIKTALLRMGIEAINMALINENAKHHPSPNNNQLDTIADDNGHDEEMEQFTLASQQLNKLLSDYDNLHLLAEERAFSQKLRALAQQYKSYCLELNQIDNNMLLLKKRAEVEEIENTFIAIVDSAIATSQAHIKVSSALVHNEIHHSSVISSIIMLIVIVAIIFFGGLFYKIAMKLHFTSLTLEEKNKALIQINQEKNDFLGIVVHDLKNPLSAILGMAEMTESSIGDAPKEELIEYTQIIQLAAKSMFQLITNLLDVSAIESGKMNMLFEPTNILPIVQNLVKDYTKRAQAKDITLHLESKLNKCIVKVDKFTTHQILDNLISNAIKYSPKGKHVYIQLIEENHKLRCAVRDEGVGLSQDDQKKLFGKFTRLSPKPTDGETSNGLGLFIVKKFIEAMNGKVWCESELGKGTQFVIEFCCNKPC